LKIKEKTATLRAFANLLLQTFPNFNPISPIPAIIPTEGDFRLIIGIEGTIIGIESLGDPGSRLADRIVELTDNFHCDIVVCATRTKGNTIHAVCDELSNRREFRLIWTSTYEAEDNSDEEFVNQLNQLKAQHILNLLQSLATL